MFLLLKPSAMKNENDVNSPNFNHQKKVREELFANVIFKKMKQAARSR